MRILVTGGRDYNDADFVFAVLDRVHAKVGITLLIEGGALGADFIAKEWAKSRGVAHETERADWHKYKKSAGHIRNGVMLEKYLPNGVVAFPGDRGTKDMIEQSLAAGLTVYDPARHWDSLLKLNLDTLLNI